MLRLSGVELYSRSVPLKQLKRKLNNCQADKISKIITISIRFQCSLILSIRAFL